MKTKLFSLALLMAAGLAQADDVRLRGPDSYPYTAPPGTDSPGFFVEAAQAIFAQHQLTVDYNVVPWNAMIAGGESGLYDCLLGIHPSEAPELNFTSDPWVVMSPHLFVRPADPLKYEDLSSFQNRRVGVLKNSRMEAALAPLKKFKPKQLVLVPEEKGLPELVRRLRIGELDVIAAPEAEMTHYLADNSLSKLVRDVGRFTDPVPLYVACGNKEKNAAWLDWLNQGELDLMKSGKWQELKKKYHLL